MTFEVFSLGDFPCRGMGGLSYPQIVTGLRKRDGLMTVQCMGCGRRYKSYGSIWKTFWMMCEGKTP